MCRKFILDYIDEINEVMNTKVEVEIRESIMCRYPLFFNCEDRRILCWGELFNNLSDEMKRLYIIHAFAVIIDYEMSRKGQSLKIKDTSYC